MAVTETQLNAFHQFARQRLSNGGAESMVQLFRDWLDACETAELADNIRRAEADIEAGRIRPAADVVDDIRRKLSSPE